MKLSKKLINVCVLASVIGVFWQAQANAGVMAQYQPPVLLKAERAIENSNPDRVLSLLEGRITELHQASFQAEGHDLICQAYRDKGEYAKAEQACNEAVNLDGSALNWSYLNNRGVMRLLLGRNDAALEDFRQAAVINPNSRKVRRNMSVALKVGQ